MRLNLGFEVKLKAFFLGRFFLDVAVIQRFRDLRMALAKWKGADGVGELTLDLVIKNGEPF